MNTTQEKLIEIYEHSRGHGICKGCGKHIEWAEVVATGKRMPFDSITVRGAFEQNNGRIIQAVSLDTNHWATCPQRERFKR